MISQSLLSCGLILAFTIVTQVAGDTRVDLTLSARELPPMDIFEGPPDPYAVIYYAPGPSDQYVKIGQTQYYDNVWEAVWPEVYTFDYIPGAQQRIKIDVMDYDWDEDDYIGYVEFPLSDIVNTFGNILDKAILGEKNKGWLKITGKVGGVVAEEVPAAEAETETKSVPLVHQLKREDVKVPSSKA